MGFFSGLLYLRVLYMYYRVSDYHEAGSIMINVEMHV